MLTTLSQQGSHALPLTAPELGSQHLAATTESHPTIVATVPAQSSNTQVHPNIVATNSVGEAPAQSYASITSTISDVSGVPLGTGPLMTTTVTTGIRNGTIEARSKVTQGPYVFCGVPGAPCGGKVNDILRKSSSSSRSPQD